MFFKKKKIMSDNPLENMDTNYENADSMAQNENENTDALANEESNALAEQPIEELHKLKAELDEAKDKYVRLVAEFENAKRRNAREREELRLTAGKDISQSLLGVLDDCERAEKQVENAKDIEALREGISLVFNKLRNVMQQKGLRRMESINQPFNPDMHEAITEIPAPSAEMEGKVIDETEPGYYLNDKLIRHAKVVVGK